MSDTIKSLKSIQTKPVESVVEIATNLLNLAQRGKTEIS